MGQMASKGAVAAYQSAQTAAILRGISLLNSTNGSQGSRSSTNTASILQLFTSTLNSDGSISNRNSSMPRL